MASPLSGARWRQATRKQWQLRARTWEREEPETLGSLAAVDAPLLRALSLEPGQHVLDLGCGSGEPALSIARWIAPRGRVLGLDISSAMLAIARRRRRLLGVRNVDFRIGDMASLSRGQRRFDRIVSRFGLMFADDIPGTLRRVLTALAPGGRAAFAVWGPVTRNPFFTLRAGAFQSFLKSPLPDPETSPHPLRLARAGLLAGLMRDAGFRGVHSDDVRVCFLSETADRFARRQLEYFRLPGNPKISAADRPRLLARLRRGAARFRSGEIVRIPANAWVVSGRR